MGLNDYLSSQRPEDQKKVDEDHAEMNCRFFLRSVPGFEFIRPLPDIGLRPAFTFSNTGQHPILNAHALLSGRLQGRKVPLLNSQQE